ncbi:MAG TPA: hypothetical protein PK110_03725 [Niabella sp.]|jgi:hypothetical protein|nr:hypothetical protein [Chitinophagaceae bacterium]HRO83909.1 hypothetical protein [Niabella sp.]HUN04465.1 hypothetical protein [Niabella sp.]
MGKKFAGGNEFKFPDGTVLLSANITPDYNTGIGSWFKEKYLWNDQKFIPTVVSRYQRKSRAESNP